MKYLITGGSGFFGEHLIKRLYGTCDIRVMSRNEGNLVKLKQKFPDIEILTGDIADRFSCHQACFGVDGIFHLAAFKHVGMAETQSVECIRSNTIGSLNLLEETLSSNIKFILGISTDKAAQVNGVYGASKMLMETMFKQFEQINPDTEYRIVRYGNVLYSTGSVLTKWIDLMKQGKEVIVTDTEATRFYWTVEQAIDLIFKCMKEAKDSTPFCPEMKGMKLGDLLSATHQKYGVGELKIKTIGLQKGENMHEKIIEGGKYSNEVTLYSITEIMDMI